MQNRPLPGTRMQQVSVIIEKQHLLVAELPCKNRVSIITGRLLVCHAIAGGLHGVNGRDGNTDGSFPKPAVYISTFTMVGDWSVPPLVTNPSL